MATINFIRDVHVSRSQGEALAKVFSGRSKKTIIGKPSKNIFPSSEFYKMVEKNKLAKEKRNA